MDISMSYRALEDDVINSRGSPSVAAGRTGLDNTGHSCGLDRIQRLADNLLAPTADHHSQQERRRTRHHSLVEEGDIHLVVAEVGCWFAKPQDDAKEGCWIRQR